MSSAGYHSNSASSAPCHQRRPFSRVQDERLLKLMLPSKHRQQHAQDCTCISAGPIRQSCFSCRRRVEHGCDLNSKDGAASSCISPLAAHYCKMRTCVECARRKMSFSRRRRFMSSSGISKDPWAKSLKRVSHTCRTGSSCQPSAVSLKPVWSETCIVKSGLFNWHIWQPAGSRCQRLSDKPTAWCCRV